MSLDIIILLSIVFTIPFLVYVWVVIDDKLKSFRHYISIVLCTLVLGVLFSIYLSFFLHEDASFLLRVSCVFMLDLVMLMLTFPVYYPCIQKYAARSNRHHHIEVEEVIACHISSYILIVLGYLYYRIFSLFLLVCVFNFFIRCIFAEKIILVGLSDYILIFVSLLFLLCFSFFSVIIRCPNCRSRVFSMDNENDLVKEVSKIVVRERILHCKTCAGIYSINRLYTYEELKIKRKLFQELQRKKKEIRARLYG